MDIVAALQTGDYLMGPYAARCFTDSCRYHNVQRSTLPGTDVGKGDLFADPSAADTQDQIVRDILFAQLTVS